MIWRAVVLMIGTPEASTTAASRSRSHSMLLSSGGVIGVAVAASVKLRDSPFGTDRIASMIRSSTVPGGVGSLRVLSLERLSTVRPPAFSVARWPPRVRVRVRVRGAARRAPRCRRGWSRRRRRAARRSGERGARRRATHRPGATTIRHDDAAQVAALDGLAHVGAALGQLAAQCRPSPRSSTYRVRRVPTRAGCPDGRRSHEPRHVGLRQRAAARSPRASRPGRRSASSTGSARVAACPRRSARPARARRAPRPRRAQAARGSRTSRTERRACRASRGPPRAARRSRP